MTSEYALLKRAQAYDKQAIGELYDQYAPLIYAYLYRRLRDAQLAEDLTGDVFVRVLQAIQSEQFWERSFRAWLYRIAHNLMVDYFRRQQDVPPLSLDEQLVADLASPVSAQAEALSYQQLRSAISQLTLDQQQVLALRFGEQLLTREVADIMGKSVGAIEALQHRALTKLRDIVHGEEE